MRSLAVLAPTRALRLLSARALHSLPPRCTAPTPLASHRLAVRHNFISAFKDKLKKEIESNKELQQTLKDLKGDQTLNKAAQAAREAAQKVQGAASQAADTASDAATKASSAAAKAAEEASKAGRGFVGKDGAAADEAQHKTTAGASSEDGKEKKASADDTPLPLFERLSRDVASLLSSFSETANSAASSAANAAKPSGPADTDTTSVVVRPPSFWEKNFNQDSPFFSGFRRFFGVAGEAAGGVGDRVFSVFGETEQAEALAELREIMPEFNQEEFLAFCSSELVPRVINAYLKGEMEVLRATCRDQAYAQLNALVMERHARQMVMDPRILHMSEVELEAVRIIGGMPTPVVSFELHQLHCIRSSLTHAVVEGSEDDIRAVYYLFALQPNEDSESEHKWQVSELAVRGMLQVY